MKQAVLYVCHGSRVPKAREEALEFIRNIMPEVQASIQEVCFLELAEPSIADGFTTCVNKGATKIAVIPLLLLTAAHAKIDIPNEIAHISSKFPNVMVTYGRPIGVDNKIADMLIDKMMAKSDVHDSSIAILVGRGSSDQDAVHDLNKIATTLQKQSNLKRVHTCFLTAARPKFDKMIDDVYHTKEQSIFVIPYLIFTGLLKREIDQTINMYDWGERNIEVCSYLGPHLILLSLFLDRVNEAIDNKDDAYTFDRGKIYDSTTN
ncbi:sirohydrochlorin chelatase [Metabacillus sediminilitoris]|uniref:Sirohydrochlorin chelatase n=1 Tax=Metabacillus sediminilitoris TaxID=2567941 RepID=A0A4S4C658_9BACI|nr:sirohydrochlorin chelatase [Metabacillus sediminilitoris]QGQ46916.1 sirohydrochlorin chelatase [Metabacillus sediminilitoris]THF83064.1 sirohydrochlorin chelatase [Metabacillus sediminilitoris]